MKVKLLVILFVIIHQFSYSQTNKALKGRVMSDSLLLPNIEVVNTTSHKSTITDTYGEFVLEAKANDSILFHHKEYQLKRIKLKSADFTSGTFSVKMDKKPEELNEVVIQQISGGWNIKPEWQPSKAAKVQGVNDGTITNGMDFVAIGKMIFGGLFKSKDKNDIPEIDVKEIAKTNFNQKFYTETLKLKEDETELFLDFCDADPKKNDLLQNLNELTLMDFLFSKNIEFKKNTQQEKM